MTKISVVYTTMWFFIVLIVAYTIFYKILAKGLFKDLPVRVKISLVVYLVFTPINFSVMVAALIKDPYLGLYGEFDQTWRLLFAQVRTFWLSLHWSFTAYYLQSACLFKKIFQAKSDQDFHGVKKRKCWLIVVELAVYCFFVAVLAFLIELNQKIFGWIYIW